MEVLVRNRSGQLGLTELLTTAGGSGTMHMWSIGLTQSVILVVHEALD